MADEQGGRRYGVARCCEPRIGISTRENGVRGCVAWKVGGAGVAGWLAGWMAWLAGWMVLGRRSVAVLILGQVTRVGTTSTGAIVGGRGWWWHEGLRRRTGSEQCWMVGAKHTPTLPYLPTSTYHYLFWTAGLTQNIVLQIG